MGPCESGVSHGASCVQGPPTLQPESEPRSCSWLHTIPLCVCMWGLVLCIHSAVHGPLIRSQRWAAINDVSSDIYLQVLVQTFVFISLGYNAQGWDSWVKLQWNVQLKKQNQKLTAISPK